VSPTLANALFEVANFLLLAGLLGFFLFKPVRKALDAERERHEQTEREVKRLHEEAEALTKQAEGERARMTQRLETERRDLLQAAQKEAEQLLEQAKQSVQNERRALEDERAAARAADATALADLVGRVAGESVRALLDTAKGPSLDRALLSSALPALSSLPEAARKSALVESVAPLEPEVHRLLREALGDGFRQRVVPELGAGLRISTDAGQVDASALSIARTAARLVTQACQEKAEAPAHD
jgi:F0F1-type ATP synthase membrane subunit b/b'